MAKFRYDGSDFDITSQGPCNIWGLVLDGEGQAWIQEANDFGTRDALSRIRELSWLLGFAVEELRARVPRHRARFPNGRHRTERLALSDKTGAFPEAYADVMFVANPITRKSRRSRSRPTGRAFRIGCSAISCCRATNGSPVSIHFGPDGCLYIVDWYNRSSRTMRCRGIIRP